MGLVIFSVGGIVLSVPCFCVEQYRLRPLAQSAFHWLHANLLALLLLATALAVFSPGAGQAIRHISLGAVHWGQDSLTVSLPLLMLSFLLFNAGLGIKVAEIKALLARPLPIIAGLLANILLPVAFILLVFLVMRGWHNPDEWGNLLAGLALIAAMPIAGSSTAWAQNMNGDLALSLGMVLFSTLLSPVTTPWVLRGLSLIATGDYQEDLQELSLHGSSIFLTLGVIVPSVLGILVHWLVGENRVKRALPYLKLLNILDLLLLSYSNASVSLPQAFANFDPDFLLVTGLVAVSLCLAAFSCGWLLARLLKLPQPERASLVFGLGMNNNGTGLVLSSMALSDHPLVMLPIIFYNLTQQFVAGMIDKLMNRKSV